MSKEAEDNYVFICTQHARRLRDVDVSKLEPATPSKKSPEYDPEHELRRRAVWEGLHIWETWPL